MRSVRPCRPAVGRVHEVSDVPETTVKNLKLAGLFTSAMTMALLAGTTLAAPTALDMTVPQAEALLAQQPVEKPELFIGDRAPNLRIGTWAQGEPVSEFVPGHTYVVEMWATWCGPCIAAIPHLNSLSEKYKAENAKVTFIGTNIWERMGGQERIDAVKEFITARGEDMKYTVAIEEEVAPTEEGGRPTGMMAETWMNPAGQNGIPAAFIVNGNGEIAWIGHPMSIDEPLAKVVAGEWDAKKAAEDALNEIRRDAVLEKAMPMLADATSSAEAYNLLTALSLTTFADEPGFLAWIAGYVAMEEGVAQRDTAWAKAICTRACEAGAWGEAGPIATLAMINYSEGEDTQGEEYLRMALKAASSDAAQLNQVAWSLVEPRRSETLTKKTAPFAADMATKACELTEWKDADSIDTLARAQWLAGEKDKAIETQQKAVDAAVDPRAKASYQRSLDEYKAGK